MVMMMVVLVLTDDDGGGAGGVDDNCNNCRLSCLNCGVIHVHTDRWAAEPWYLLYIMHIVRG